VGVGAGGLGGTAVVVGAVGTLCIAGTGANVGVTWVVVVS